MALTFEPIATTTVASPTTTITFGSIPQTYTTLRIIAYIVSADGSANTYVQFNADTTQANYYLHKAYGYQGANYGYKYNGNFFDIGVNTGTNPFMFEMDIQQYVRTTNYKTALYRIGAAVRSTVQSGVVSAGGIVWQNTSALTSVAFTLGGANFAVGTNATLYGIKAA